MGVLIEVGIFLSGETCMINFVLKNVKLPVASIPGIFFWVLIFFPIFQSSLSFESSNPPGIDHQRKLP